MSMTMAKTTTTVTTTTTTTTNKQINRQQYWSKCKLTNHHHYHFVIFFNLGRRADSMILFHKLKIIKAYRFQWITIEYYKDVRKIEKLSTQTHTSIRSLVTFWIIQTQ